MIDPAKICARRKAAKITQTEAATMIGVTLRAWQFWEAGERKMPQAAWELFQIKTQPRK